MSAGHNARGLWQISLAFLLHVVCTHGVAAQALPPTRLLKLSHWNVRVGPADHEYRAAVYGTERFSATAKQLPCNPSGLAFRVVLKAGQFPVTGSLTLALEIQPNNLAEIRFSLSQRKEWAGNLRCRLIATQGEAVEWCRMGPQGGLVCEVLEAQTDGNEVWLTRLRISGKWVLLHGRLQGLSQNGLPFDEGRFAFPLPAHWFTGDARPFY